MMILLQRNIEREEARERNSLEIIGLHNNVTLLALQCQNIGIYSGELNYCKVLLLRDKIL